MERFYRAVVRGRRPILAVFLLLTVLCGVMSGFVEVNYDLNDYLPTDSPSTLALEQMEEEFTGGIPNARVLVQDVTVPEALEYKEQIAAVDGVTGVTWLDDAANLATPLAMLDTDTVESYYRDGAALFSVTIDERMCVSAVEGIRAIIGEDNAMSGSAVNTAVATTSTVDQVRFIVVFAVLFVLLVLALTTTSWVEPLVVLGGLGVAIAINTGTNLIFGSISFVTNSAGSILQLAVSLDYSVFLLHRFEECLEEQPDPEEAMVTALCKSTGSILSSGLTTVIGFLALVFMRFLLGADLGLALSKGVCISLITVFVFMPSLILATRKWTDRTRHRSFVPSFRGLGRLVTRLALPMVVLFAVVVVPANLASGANSFYYGAGHIFGPETQLGADMETIEGYFGKSDTYVLMVPKGDRASERSLSQELQELPEVKSILSYVDSVGASIPTSYLDEDTLALLESDDYSRMVLTVEAEYEGEAAFSLVESVREIAQKYYPDTYALAGEGVSTYDLMDTITADMTKVNAIAIGAVFVVLLLTMRSVVLPALLVLSIETAIWINLAVPYFAGDTVFYISYLIISSVQLGATVDYAILFTDRYRECRTELGITDRREAVRETISTTTVSLLTSGSCLTVVGFLMGCFSTHGIISQLGMFLGRGTLCSLAIVFFVLPGLLMLFDGVILPRTHRNPK